MTKRHSAAQGLIDRSVSQGGRTSEVVYARGLAVAMARRCQRAESSPVAEDYHGTEDGQTWHVRLVRSARGGARPNSGGKRKGAGRKPGKAIAVRRVMVLLDAETAAIVGEMEATGLTASGAIRDCIRRAGEDSRAWNQ